MAKRRPKRLPQIPPDDELRRVIGATSHERDRLILLLMHMMALRVSEVVKLDVPHVDFKRTTLFLSQAKGGKDAYLPIPKHLVNPLRGWIGARRDGPVFISRKRCRLTTRAVQHLVKRCAVKAGLYGATEPRKYHPHSFRHGAATEMMRRRVPLPIIQRILRHSSLQTTQVYLSVTPDDLREALDG
jgi:integrase